MESDLFEIENGPFLREVPVLFPVIRELRSRILKFAQPRAMASKVSDEFVVPLCRTHHRQLHHGGNEVTWWIDMDIDPLPIARDLWDRSHGKAQATNGHDATEAPERKTNVE